MGVDGEGDKILPRHIPGLIVFRKKRKILCGEFFCWPKCLGILGCVVPGESFGGTWGGRVFDGSFVLQGVFRFSPGEGLSKR